MVVDVVSGLVEFLLARIAEDENVARNHPTPGPWKIAEVTGYREPRYQVGPVREDDGGLVATEAQYFERWQPARVLAECEAKRRIVEMHRADGAPVVDLLGMEYEFCWTCSDSGPDAQAWPCDTIKALAAVYADHPDYRDEWRP